MMLSPASTTGKNLSWYREEISSSGTVMSNANETRPMRSATFLKRATILEASMTSTAVISPVPLSRTAFIITGPEDTLSESTTGRSPLRLRTVSSGVSPATDSAGAGPAADIPEYTAGMHEWRHETARKMAATAVFLSEDIYERQ